MEEKVKALNLMGFAILPKVAIKGTKPYSAQKELKYLLTLLGRAS